MKSFWRSLLTFQTIPYPFFQYGRAIHCLLLRHSPRILLRHIIESRLKRLELAFRLDLSAEKAEFEGGGGARRHVFSGKHPSVNRLPAMQVTADGLYNDQK